MIYIKILWPLYVILVSNVLLWTGVIATDGIIINGDFNFPLLNENFLKSYYPLWTDILSQNNFERLPRLVMLSPFLALAALGLEVAIILKALLVSTFTLATLSMYLFLESLQKHTKIHKGLVTKIICLIGGFVFAYNPVSLQFAGGISIFFSLAVLPLLLFVILTRFNDRYFPLYVSGLLLLSLGHPFILIMNILVSLVFLVLIHQKANIRIISKQLAFSTIAFMLLFAWYWIPYASYPVTSTELGRNIDQSTIDVISDNDPLHILLLERDRFLYVNTEPPEPIQSTIHYVSLSLIVGIALVTPLIISRLPSKIGYFFIGGFLLSVVISLGTKGPFGEAYYSIVTESNLGWIFRSPLKFQLYESFFVSALFGISVSILQARIGKRTALTAFSLVLLVGATSYGIYDANVNSFKPRAIPNEYYEISSILAQKDDDYKVIYYPIYAGQTYWSEGNSIGPFDSKSSTKPTFAVSSSRNYVQDMLVEPYSKIVIQDYPVVPFRTYNFYQFLTSLGIKYIVFHNDQNKEIDKQNLNYILMYYPVNILYNRTDWYLFELDTAVRPPVFATTNAVLVENLPDILKVAKSNLTALYISSNLENVIPIEQQLSSIAIYDNNLTSKEHVRGNQNFIAFDLLSNYQNNWKNDGENINANLTFNDEGLRISTVSERISWLLSDPIDISHQDSLLVSFRMKTEDADGIRLRLIGYYPEEGRWKDIDSVTWGIRGTTNWEDYWSIIHYPLDFTKIRYAISTGRPIETAESSTIWIGNVSVFDLKDSGTSYSEILDYKQLNPSRWVISVNASKPYLLVIPETYDNGWSAQVKQREIESILVNGVITGFYIEELGEYEIFVEYKPQKLFELGSMISMISLFGFVGYFILIHRKYTWNISVLVKNIIKKLRV